MDAANLLKPMLGRGELRCIGATTLDEYRKYIEKVLVAISRANTLDDIVQKTHQQPFVVSLASHEALRCSALLRTSKSLNLKTLNFTRLNHVVCCVRHRTRRWSAGSSRSSSPSPPSSTPSPSCAVCASGKPAFLSFILRTVHVLRTVHYAA